MSKFFGNFGGQYIGEVLKPAVLELERGYREIVPSPEFQKEFQVCLRDYAGRPTPLYFAENVTRDLGGAKVYVKLEGLANTGAHKINNALGQALLAKYMGKKRVIAETGAGQHGVATAAACAKLGLECEVFMGAVDVRRQQPNVFLMKQYGATVTQVDEGTRTLKDAVNRALKEWAARCDDTYYLLGSALGPYPYPDMVRDFQSVIGREIKAALLEREGRLPDMIIACCGGGSNAIGSFAEFLQEKIQLVAVEAGGLSEEPGAHATRMSGLGRVGIVEGYKSYFLQTDDGQVLPTHSISAGLDYAGIGPQLAKLGLDKRVIFEKATDKEVLAAYQYFAKREGLLFALESAHAASYARQIVPQMSKDQIVVLTMSGRGDKDIFITAPALYTQEWKAFLKQESTD
ncbi:MAG TPA: tryptophan synthase subunit beta [Candidatus Bathyarchaeia archaeon]|nr:tryptophan synthase subunit beta [Candidatus Bathyarchaeia archaeon]